jgi:hypothetical protein
VATGVDGVEDDGDAGVLESRHSCLGKKTLELKLKGSALDGGYLQRMHVGNLLPPSITAAWSGAAPLTACGRRRRSASRT